MDGTLSNLDSVLVALPMFAVLFLAVFRLDELICRSPKRAARRPLAGGVDGDGMPICVEPDGKPLGALRLRPAEGAGR